MRKSPERAKIQDFIKVNDHLRKVIEIVTPATETAPGICRYVDSAITDHTVAEEMKVSVSTVRSLRTTGFGNLFNRGNTEASNSGEVAALKAEVVSLRSKLAMQQSEDSLLWMRTDVIVEHFNRAIDNLALNRALPGQSGLKIKPRVMRQLPQAAE